MDQFVEIKIIQSVVQPDIRISAEQPNIDFVKKIVDVTLEYDLIEQAGLHIQEVTKVEGDGNTEQSTVKFLVFRNVQDHAESSRQYIV